MRKLLYTLFALSTSSYVYAEKTPFTSFNAEFSVSSGFFTIGEAGVDLKVDENGNYFYDSYTKPRGIAKALVDDTIKENTQGKFDNLDVHPDRYFFERKGGKKERTTIIEFDYNDEVATNIAVDPVYTAEMQWNSLDRFSMQLQIMADFWRGHESLTYHVVEDDDTKFYTFAVRDRETIKIPAGKFDTVKIEHVRSNKKRTTYYWLAPELGYLPIKVYHKKRGDPSITMEMTKHNGQPLPAKQM